ncbi:MULTISPECIES: energy transducer TonB [unclassified Duganella]|uniref:energy transducer TonB n=1 Tax=unclassified Duganella TaxID=2636909 RepID=UPI000E353642|nr:MULTISPECIES: energy transducer TonB [unclassified Duganella]RFP13783.1 energy transducer TonB [Duganella sp. BJB475]RFP36491.1 energy transducer TonB [Duganella sp. BJB476]
MQQELNFPQFGRNSNSRRSSLLLIVALHLLVAWFMLQKTGKISLFFVAAPSRITQVSMLSSGAGSSTASAAGIAIEHMPTPALPRLDFGPTFTIKAEATTEDAAVVHASPTSQSQSLPQDAAHAPGVSAALGAGASTGSGAGTAQGKGAGSSAGPDDFESLPAAVLAVECDTPTYPFEAKLRGQEGTARMALRIDAQGLVAESRIMKSSRSLALDRASRNAIALCRFVPPMQNGVAVGGWVSLNYIWKLREIRGVFRDSP